MKQTKLTINRKPYHQAYQRHHIMPNVTEALCKTQ